MALIKHAESGSIAQDAVVLDLGDLRQEARRMRERAQREAERIVEEARAERERLIATAHQEGLDAGRREGREQGMGEGRQQGKQEAHQAVAARLSELDSALAAALDAIEGAREDMLQQARADVLEFAAAVAERITRRAVELDDQTALRQVEACLALVLKPTTLVVAINPDDRSVVAEALPALLERFARSAAAELVEDTSLTRGSASVRTAYGSVEARIDEQIARIVGSVLPPRRIEQEMVRPLTRREPAPEPPDDAPAQEESP